MKGLDHAVLSLDVILYFLKVIRDPTEVFLLLPVYRLLCPLSTRQDVLDGVGGYEVFTRTKSLHWFFCDFWDWSFLVAAVIGEIAD